MSDHQVLDSESINSVLSKLLGLRNEVRQIIDGLHYGRDHLGLEDYSRGEVETLLHQYKQRLELIVNPILILTKALEALEALESITPKFPIRIVSEEVWRDFRGKLNIHEDAIRAAFELFDGQPLTMEGLEKTSPVSPEELDNA